MRCGAVGSPLSVESSNNKNESYIRKKLLREKIYRASKIDILRFPPDFNNDMVSQFPKQ